MMRATRLRGLRRFATRCGGRTHPRVSFQSCDRPSLFRRSTKCLPSATEAAIARENATGAHNYHPLVRNQCAVVSVKSHCVVPCDNSRWSSIGAKECMCGTWKGLGQHVHSSHVLTAKIHTLLLYAQLPRLPERLFGGEPGTQPPSHPRRAGNPGPAPDAHLQSLPQRVPGMDMPFAPTPPAACFGWKAMPKPHRLAVAPFVEVD